LKYRIDPAGSLIAVTMADNGLNADNVAGDGIYSGLIPAQPANTLVAFRVEASDQFTPAGLTQFPREAPVRECLVRFGESRPPGAFGSYRFWITQANFNFWSGREKLSSENIDATFVYGANRVIYNIGARYGGSPYSAPGYNTPTGNLCGYSLDFLRDDWLLGDTRFVLDYLTRDPTGQREQLMFWFLEQFGLPNNYRRYIRLAVNGVLRGTVYEDAQRPGNDMIEQWFPNDTEGSLFKTDIWDEFNDAGGRIGSAVLLNSLENFTTTDGVRKVARYRWGWEPRATRQSANDFTDLFALVDAANAPASGYQSAIEGLVDVEHWMKTFCMNDLASYWDGFGNPNCKNTYVYKPQSDTWKLMSWDFDVGLGVFNDPVDAPLFPDLADSAMMRLYSFPGFVRHYWGAMDEALNTFFRIGPGTPIETLLDKKYAAFQTNALALESPASIKSWITQRRAFLAGQLAAVATSFSVSGPASLTTNRNAIVLTGTAPVNVRTITVNGVPWTVTWLSLTSWQLVVPVANGTTNLSVQALNRLQQPITGASRTITVTCTAPDEQPENALVFNELMPLPRVPGAEYVELFNRSTNYSFDLSGWQVNGLDYTFPPGTIISNQQHLVLAKDRAAFGAGYGWGIHVAGLFNGGLQANGETLTLLRPGTDPAPPSEIAKVRYETTLPWPLGAEGTGSSYQLIDPAQDHWRAGNWSLVPTNTQSQTQPQWVYFSTNGTASSSILYLYLASAGDIYIDELKLVAGTVPGAGVNLVANGDFETALASWLVSGNFSQSTPSTLTKHSGNASLHMVATAPGTGNGNSIYQTISPQLTPNAPYALSFWYLQTTNGGPLTVRLSAYGVTSGSINPAPPANPVLTIANPGTANSVRAVLPAFPPLWINELQAENLTGITNRAGQPVPWIELCNPTSNSVSLAGCFLANNYTNLLQWPFPANATLAPGEFKIIFADNQTQLTTATEWHANFTLTPGFGQLALSRLHNSEPQVLDFTAYRALQANRSWGSLPDAQCYHRQQFFYPTPAQTNNGTAAPLPLFINEWMADNNLTLADPVDEDFEDWFEIYNPGEQPVDLGGCFLTDTLTDKFQSQVPANGHYVVPPHGFLLVWADGESGQNSTNVPDLHVGFKLDKTGEGIYLFASDGTAVDAITFGNQATDVTQGRFPDGADAVFVTATPTPRQANVLANTPPILAGIPQQFVHAGQTLQLTVFATDAQSAVQQLAFSLEPGFPAGASIHPVTGLFSWPVPALPIPSTNSITVRVTDNGLPPLSDVESFTAIVLPRPQLAVAPAGSILQLSFTGLPGRAYQVQYKNELSDAAWL
ncbi:MAG TPA: lamin tail domain-containing protein, partial [Clostridia bacterium]|nr:lamin tail domain-containing protein [Clostridia bacterium]